jgi:TonB family protein
MSAAVLNAIWTCSLQAAVVILIGAIAAAAPWWCDDARARCVLWRIVLTTVIVLPAIALAWPSPAPAGAAGAGKLDVLVAMIGDSTGGASPVTRMGPPLVLAVLAAGVLVRAVRLGVGAVALRRLARGPELTLAAFDRIRQELGAQARLVAGGAVQPFTFGSRDAVVVVPDTFSGETVDVQRAVLVHELLHVRRGDWLQTTIEEVCCALLWFHPGVWWAVGELRLAREEVVDREASQLSGSRRAYMRTLLEFAGRRDAHLLRAVAFFRRRQLVRRLAALSKEASMSTRSRIVTGVAAALVLLVSAHGARAAFPLSTGQQASADAKAADAAGAGGQASALEQQAYKVPKDAPPPRKIHDVPFPYPDSVKSVVTSALFVTRLVIDVDGSVVEARILRQRIDGPPVAAQALAQAVKQLSEGTIAVVRQWRFEPPAKAPLAMTVSVSYSLDGKKDAGAPPPPPPPPGPGDGSVTRPVPVKQPNAVYPESAKRDKVQGVVRLAVLIGKDGTVKDARVVQSVPALDQAALDAVRQWTFRPGTRDGEPVDTKVELSINFTLK